jgi:hypothetical protein
VSARSTKWPVFAPLVWRKRDWEPDQRRRETNYLTYALIVAQVDPEQAQIVRRKAGL